jgi:membrane protein
MRSRPMEFARACFARVVEIQFVERAVTLASLTFTALIPLGVVVGSLSPATTGNSIVHSLVHRFRLDGQTRELVEGIFSPPEDVRSAVSVVGIALVIVSTLSFTRALQRVYERSWRLPSRGIKGTPAGIVWILGVALFIALFLELKDNLIAASGPVVGIVLSLLFGSAFWLATPFVLLARRLPWRSVVPTALLTSVAVTIAGIVSSAYMPTAIADSARRYGEIGVTIALVTWLVAMGFVVVLCAAIGAVIAERLEPAAVREQPETT